MSGEPIVLVDEDGVEVHLHPAVPEWAVDLHVLRAHAYANPPFRSLVLTITDRCNLRCDFCCHPHLESELPREDCLRLAREACSLDFVEVWLTGGEPFLRYPLLLELASICRDGGRMLGVQTSGYWARTPDRARDMAREMVERGVFCVTFSWDPSHAEVVSRETVEQGIDACMEAGLHVRLRGNFVEASATHASLGLDPARWMPYANFSVRADTVDPVGRAAGLVQLRRPRAPSAPVDLRCPGHVELQHVVYARDGLTMPCCSVWAGYDTPALSLGDWRARSLAEGLDVHEADSYYRAIVDRGFPALYARLEARDRALAARLPDLRTVESPCELCARLMTSPDAPAIRSLAGE